MKLKKFRLLAVMFVACVFVLTLSACNATNILTKEKTDGLHKGSIFTETVVFLKVFEEKYIDVELEGKEIMFRLSEEKIETAKQLNKGENVTLTYEKSEYGESIVLKIEREGEKGTVKDQDKGNEKEDDFVSSQGYSIKTVDYFTYQNVTPSQDKIIYEFNKEVYATIEVLPEQSEIQKLRWRAAEELKSVGPLVESKKENIPYSAFESSEFIFTAKGETYTESIVVVEMEGKLLRLVLHTAKGESEALLYDQLRMIN